LNAATDNLVSFTQAEYSITDLLDHFFATHYFAAHYLLEMHY